MKRVIGYLAHDLSDPAVERRIAMFDAGGAEVNLAGFSRKDGALPSHPSAQQALMLGTTHDARLVHRAGSVVRVLQSRILDLRRHFAGADAIVARNLEMLVIAAAVIRKMSPRPRLVFECLDLHRLIVSPGLKGTLLRQIEKRLGRSVDLIVTSSPAFADQHLTSAFPHAPILLVENKVFGGGAADRADETLPGPPWRIGWFGILRCRRSFDLLGAMSNHFAGDVEIVLRGRPSNAIFPNLSEEIARYPHMRFAGPYAYPKDLKAMYQDVHFAWCLDFYETGQNSDWLLPNRLYESGFHRTVQIAQSTVETGRFLSRLNTGLVLNEPIESNLKEFLSTLSPERFTKMLENARKIPDERWITAKPEAEAVVSQICGTSV